MIPPAALALLLGACASTPLPPLAPTGLVTQTLLDTETSLDVAGYGPALTVVVPPDALALQVEAQGPSDVWLALAEVRPPAGPLLVDPGWRQRDATRGEACLDCALRLVPRPGAFAAYWPQDPHIPLLPGSWTLRALAWRRTGTDSALVPWSGQVRLRVEVLRGPSVPARARLPLWVSVPQILNGQPGSAVAADLAVALAAHLTPAGVDLDLAGVTTAGSELAGPGDLAAFCPLVVPPGTRAVHLVLLPGPGKPLAGLACGLPGAQGGAVLLPWAASPTVAPDRVAAHEIGHLLGLFHVTEAAVSGPLAGRQDPLTDTSAADTDNWMVAGHQAPAPSWTADQGAILRARPWLWLAGEVR